MCNSHSTTPLPSGKPTKPTPNFPLFPHATKRWAKKIKGKLRYFGPWDDANGALADYHAFLEGKPLTHDPDTRSLTPGPDTHDNRASQDLEKPKKTYPDFPLFAHNTKRWAKKIRGKVHYFGPWENWQAALDNYLKQKDDLHNGRKAREDPDAITVKRMVNKFLKAKKALVESGDLAELTWRDYKSACEEILASFGPSRLVMDLRPDDFGPLRKQTAKKWGPQRLSKTIQFIRCVFKFAYDAELIDRPIRFGPEFKRPTKGVLRRQRAAAGPQLFTAEEVRRMIDTAGFPLKAMLLLGVNCGFGNSDCGNLPQSAIDWQKDILDYPRPKTGIPRRCPLWPETLAALREALAERPAAKKEDHAGLVFLTRCGDSWHTGTPDGPLNRETGKLLRKLGINGRKRLGFYTLRHSFRTVADEAKDQPAVDYMMGHEVPHMSSVYRETIADERLRVVSEHVRKWLFPSLAFLTTSEKPGESIRAQ